MYSSGQHGRNDTSRDTGKDLMISGAAASVSCLLTVRLPSLKPAIGLALLLRSMTTIELCM